MTLLVCYRTCQSAPMWFSARHHSSCGACFKRDARIRHPRECPTPLQPSIPTSLIAVPESVVNGLINPSLFPRVNNGRPLPSQRERRHESVVEPVVRRRVRSPVDPRIVVSARIGGPPCVGP